MLVHDYDDEHTLDDEEALSNSDTGSTELDALQKVMKCFYYDHKLYHLFLYCMCCIQIA